MDAREFKHIFLPLGDRLYRLAFRLLRRSDEAEDVVQEVFLKLLGMGEKLDTYRNKEALAMTMVRNLALDRIRTRHTVSEEEVTLPEQTVRDDPPDILLDRKEKAGRAMAIIDALGEPARSVIHMRDVEGCAYEEIATVTGLTVNNVRVVLSRARKRVRETLLKEIDHGNGTAESTAGEIL